MIKRKTTHYNLTFSEAFVIAEAHEGVVITKKEVNENLNLIFDHYKGSGFTLISLRQNSYSLDKDIYSLKQIKKLTAIAIVSNVCGMKEKAEIEQMSFGKSFAFFSNLDDAIQWARSVKSFPY